VQPTIGPGLKDETKFRLPDQDTTNLAMLGTEVLVEDSSLDLVEAMDDKEMVLAMAMVLEESMAAVVIFVEETVSQDINKHQFIRLAEINKQ
jgi:hypothetical protein